MTLHDSRTDFEHLIMEFNSEETFLYYEELFSCCRLLTDGQRRLLLEKAREMIAGKKPEQSFLSKNKRLEIRKKSS